MKYTDYLEFLSPEEIRIRGRRIGLENILWRYLALKQTPEQIAAEYLDLAIEAVEAAIAYYRDHQIEMNAYLDAWLAQSNQLIEAQERNPSPEIARLTAFKADGRARQKTV